MLQLCRINPTDERNVVPSRFSVDDVEAMIDLAINDAKAGHNVYVEARTVDPALRGSKRGGVDHTAWVFGFVCDSDADKGRAGNITAKPTLAVETSPGNYHLWYLLDQPIRAAEAKKIGEAIRKGSGADQDTGVITQCYRIAGTPNFPSLAKRKRGRTAIDPTRIIGHSGRLWKADELLAAFATPLIATPTPASTSSSDDDEVTLSDELLELIRYGAKGKDRSAEFHSVIGRLKKRHWSIDTIVALLEKYPDGIAQKYVGRIREEVERSFNKFINGGAATVGRANVGANISTGNTAAGAHVLRTIHIVASQLPRMLVETEEALRASGMPIFKRAGALVHPTVETILAADGHKTMIAQLRAFTADALIIWVSDAALFRRFKRNQWVDTDPPRQVINSLLAHADRWTIPRVSGIITTPTLRSDGSLLADPGYDRHSELYLLPEFGPVTISQRPTRNEAIAALGLLTDLFSEFSFVGPLDRAVALSGLLTALVRGSLATAPMYLIRAHTPGTGKSYLVDVIATVATGRPCPVITAGKSEEETEKRLGTILLGGSPIVSLDNCNHDLEGQLLCRLTERPLVKIRILGRSEMPECECRTTVFATGNNISLRGDMIRRGLLCNLDAPIERPELRTFQHEPLRQVMNDRRTYVAAGLTIIRAYLTANTPAVCKSIGSYSDWSTMVRSPLVWLDQPDPVESMDDAREDDAELANIRELFTLWPDYLDLDERYKTGRIIEIACQPLASNDFNRQPLRDLLLRVAGTTQGAVSPERLGKWLRKISGRVVDGFRLCSGRLNQASLCFWLTKL